MGSEACTPLEVGGFQPIISLIEIGLEKLQKDYLYAFLGNLKQLL